MSGDPPTLRHLGQEAVLAAQAVAEAIRLARTVQHEGSADAVILRTLSESRVTHVVGTKEFAFGDNRHAERTGASEL